MFSKVRRMIKYTDMFYSSQMLRHEDEEQYRTVTGGLLSIAIIITTIIGFASMIQETLDRSTITSSVEMVKKQDPTPSTFTTSSSQNFMFAVEIWLVNVTGPERYFDIHFSQQIRSGLNLEERIFLPLEPCTSQHWSSIPFLESKFDMLNIGNWLCPPIGSTYQIYGKYSSEDYSKYILTVSNCKNQTDPSRPCASPDKINQLYQDFRSSFYFTLYYTNPIINPSNKNYKSYYLQDEDYVIFGKNVGSQAFIYFTDYTIVTDYSIWPFKDIAYDQGLLVQAVAINHPYQAVENGILANINIAKSANSVTYTREVQKISSVFSFIGGMVSAASALLFFIKAYTSFAFQISIAFSIFLPRKDQQKQSKPSINFITFIKLYIYIICDKLGIKLEWQNIRYLADCQAEIAKQLDIKSIVKRFVFIQYCLTNIFQDYQLDGLQINTPSSVESIKTIREKCVCIIDDDVRSEQSEQKSNQIIKNNIILQPEPSSSNFQMREHGLSKFNKNQNLVILDHQSQEFQSCQKLKKKTVVIHSNSIKNNFKKDEIRKKNLRLLSIHSKHGDGISKKIWDSLERQVKESIDVNENIEVKAKSFQRNSILKETCYQHDFYDINLFINLMLDLIIILILKGKEPPLQLSLQDQTLASYINVR